MYELRDQGLMNRLELERNQWNGVQSDVFEYRDDKLHRYTTGKKVGSGDAKVEMHVSLHEHLSTFVFLFCI